jgi:PilZ domain-containing protein
MINEDTPAQQRSNEVIRSSMEVHSRSNSRRHPRFKLDANLKIRSRSEGLLNGYALDISECGLAAMLVMEVSIGEIVDLDFDLPLGPVSVRAVVRERSAFRYGFQFVQPNPAHRQIVEACTTLPPQD